VRVPSLAVGCPAVRSAGALHRAARWDELGELDRVRGVDRRGIRARLRGTRSAISSSAPTTSRRSRHGSRRVAGCTEIGLLVGPDDVGVP